MSGGKKGCIMLQGTASHVGKSVLTAALCRILRDDGIRVAPFKPQNMALNSFVTGEGGEIGRAQAFQALCAGIEPSVDMNPILLKPTDDSRTQVIIHGRVYGDMSAKEYHLFKKEAKGFVFESFSRLASRYDVIVIEGAGSPAEINLRDGDIANMGFARVIGAPVVVVGDIDRGGVFASLIGTMELLEPEERGLVRGFIINKFRGDIDLLYPGLDFLKKRTGIPVIGVVPYVTGLRLPEEDGVALDAGQSALKAGDKGLRIGVIRLPRISNFTDFDPLLAEPDVEVSYVTAPEGLAQCDCVIIPGSKNTISDLRFLWDYGLAEAILSFAGKGRMVMGICGGFQMLGSSVIDPHHVESDDGEVRGLGLLKVSTSLTRDKKTYQVEGVTGDGLAGWGLEVKGYEIHMGETSGDASSFVDIKKRNGRAVDLRDGAVSEDGMVIGTYIHGIFDNDGFRRWFLNRIRGFKGGRGSVSFERCMEQGIERLASVVRESLDMELLYSLIGYKGYVV